MEEKHLENFGHGSEVIRQGGTISLSFLQAHLYCTVLSRIDKMFSMAVLYDHNTHLIIYSIRFVSV